MHEKGFAPSFFFLARTFSFHFLPHAMSLKSPMLSCLVFTLLERHGHDMVGVMLLSMAKVFREGEGAKNNNLRLVDYDTQNLPRFILQLLSDTKEVGDQRQGMLDLSVRFARTKTLLGRGPKTTFAVASSTWEIIWASFLLENLI